jgi:hypothetical protein
MTTFAQNNSNPHNALQSTGPRAETGQASSKFNTVKQILLANMRMLPGERREEWNTFRRRYAHSLSPNGAAEILCAEQIALESWRLLRVPRLEYWSMDLASREKGLKSRDEGLASSSENKPFANSVCQQPYEPPDIWDEDAINDQFLAFVQSPWLEIMMRYETYLSNQRWKNYEQLRLLKKMGARSPVEAHERAIAQTARSSAAKRDFHDDESYEVSDEEFAALEAEVNHQ